ncbi:ATP-binding cassette domain-containing protein [Paenibacillus alkaliterrae]|uniref:ATP-binding cassette domain-containing protein n=1 Tax=Paenibacillus alkaliterrae TaxID=320909 RepID=UPI00228620B6|nr:ATP-binding cassette domain-containing protein [Paenibacillus alkaliterrae]
MLFKVKCVKKEWDGSALFENITFEVREGERLVLFGRNGNGKTTLLHGLTGRLPFDGERIRMGDHGGKMLNAAKLRHFGLEHPLLSAKRGTEDEGAIGGADGKRTKARPA